MRRNVQNLIEREEGDQGLSPFSNEIINALMLENFKMPTILAYQGLINPKDHLDTFNDYIDLTQVSQAVRCHCFVVTLMKGAKKWFKKFLPQTITLWQQLAPKFTKQFQAVQVHASPYIDLENIKQQKDESLKSYLRRFSEAPAQTEIVPPGGTLMALVTRDQTLEEYKKA